MAGEQRTANIWMTLITILWALLGIGVVILILWWAGIIGGEPGAAADGDGTTSTATSDNGEDQAVQNGEANDGNGAETAEGSVESDETAAGDDDQENGDRELQSVFTSEQAERGQEEFSASCAQCHGGQLDGDPPLSGGAFAATWDGMPVNALFEVISQTMPQDNPGSLSDETYADITAHILAFNGMPDGDNQLQPGDDETLRTLITLDGSTGDSADTNGADTADENGNGADTDTEESTENGAGGGEGWFTEEQAELGAEDYSASCASCHGEDGTGGSDPPLADGALEGSFSTVWELFEYTSTEMPDDDPGSLDEETYVNIVAHLLALNDYGAGEEELEADEDQMSEMELGNGGNGNGEAADGEEASDEDEDMVEQVDAEQPAEGEQPGQGEGWIEFTIQPERATINILGPGGFVGQVSGQDGGGTISGLEPGDYILVASLGNFDHQVVTEVRQHETSRVDLVITELINSADLSGQNSQADQASSNQQDGQDDPAGDSAANNNADTSNGDEADQNVNGNAGNGDGAGWYTEEQAEAGAEDYSASCASCHGEDGTGGSDPPLADGALEGSFSTVWELFEYTSTEMPDDAPGSLDEETYLDIVAHLLALNNYEAGDEELEADEEQLSDMELSGNGDGESQDRDGAADPEDSNGETADQDDGQAEQQTAAQRGQSAYSSNCAMCHGPSLEGIEAPPLAGPVFMERWGGHPVDWFYFQAYTSMPPDDPGSLDDQAYADIMVYILSENGLLEGDEEFRPFDPLLETMIIGAAQQQDFTLQYRIEELRRTVHEPFEEAEQEDSETGAAESGVPATPENGADDSGDNSGNGEDTDDSEDADSEDTDGAIEDNVVQPVDAVPAEGAGNIEDEGGEGNGGNGE